MMPARLRTFNQAGTLGFVLSVYATGDTRAALELLEIVRPLIDAQEPVADIHAALAFTDDALHGRMSVEDAYAAVAEASSNAAA